jgi:predicted permease
MRRHLFDLESGEAAVQALTIAAPNYAAVGLPLIAAVLGPAGPTYIALSIATSSIVLSPLTLATLETNKTSADGKDSGAPLQAIGRSLFKPIVLRAGVTCTDTYFAETAVEQRSHRRP